MKKYNVCFVIMLIVFLFSILLPGCTAAGDDPFLGTWVGQVGWWNELTITKSGDIYFFKATDGDSAYEGAFNDQNGKLFMSDRYYFVYDESSDQLVLTPGGTRLNRKQ